MKKIIDKFSKQSKTYKKYRPTYPTELYELILSLIEDENRITCWDCGTGNGQVAIQLSKYFKTVYATDISENQLRIADKKTNIIYQVQRAEKTTFEDNSFNLITVAQAAHWFDIESFNKEAKRLLKPNGLICIWGYGLLHIDEKTDDIINEFYTQIINPYWNKEREHIDNAYESINLDFELLKSPENMYIRTNWQLKDLIGYLNSWSGVQNYMQQNNGENPVDLITKRLEEIWKTNEEKEIKFPIFMKIGLVDK